MNKKKHKQASTPDCAFSIIGLINQINYNKKRAGVPTH